MSKWLSKIFKLYEPPVVQHNPRSWDKSTKPYEVFQKRYIWDKYSRVIRNNPKWVHYKYYDTLEGALQAIKDLRCNLYHNGVQDYPGESRETEYPHIIPTLTIERFKAGKRTTKINM